MKRLFCLLLLSFFLGGCWIYGKGNYVGYVIAVEQGIFWSRAWLKTDLTSSDADAFLIRKSDYEMQQELTKLAEDKIKIRIDYQRHFMTVAIEDNDEILKYEIMK
jgi:hypothetical protein